MTIGNSGLGRTLGRPGNDPSQDQYNDNNNTNTRINNNNLSRLMGAVLSNSRSYNSHGRVTDPNEGFRAFSYNSKNSEGIFGNMFGDTKELTDEQYRADVIDQASYKGFELFQTLQNRTGVYYQETRNAMEFFKRDNNRVVQPIFEQFINEVESNLQLYRFCASYASSFFASDLVTAVYNGSVGAIISDDRKQLSIVFGNFVNVLCLQFLSWLEGHPDAINLIHQMTPANKHKVDMFESMIDGCQSKLLNITIGNTQFPFPWQKGVMKRINDKTQVKSTLFEGYDFHNGQGVPGAGGYFMTATDHNPQSAQSDVYNLLSSFVNNAGGNPNVKPASNHTHPTDVYVNNTWGDDPKEETLLDLVKKMNPVNRKDFSFNEIFTLVPELKYNRYLADPRIFRFVSRSLKLKTEQNKPEFYKGVWATKNTIPLIRIDWDEGIYDYELISLGGLDVLTVLTDPSKVLPNIAENMEAAATEAFDDYWEKVNEITDKENNPVTITECVKLEKEPNVLYGNKPVVIDNNEDIISTIHSLSNYYDPDEKLSAFVIPFTAKKIFQLESSVNYSDVYKVFPSLVKDRCNLESMRDFYNEIRDGLELIESDELKNLVTMHVTDTINRWLIECRFYSDKNDVPGFLALDDFIKDFDQFVNLLKEKDVPTLKSFMLLTKNEFLRENLTLFAQVESRDKYIKKETSKYTDDLLKIKSKLFESAMVIERDFIVAKINPMTPPTGWDQIVIAKSGIPAFDHVYQKSQETFIKHFSRKVPLLTVYGKDNHNRFWVTTESEFDNKIYSLRPVSMKSNIQLLRITK